MERTLGTKEEQEARRLAAGRLLLAGKNNIEVVRALQVSPSSVGRWKAIVRRHGVEGLRTKPSTGRPPKLPRTRMKTLTRILIKGALAAGFSSDLWTGRRVAEVIRQRFDVDYHPHHVLKLLRQLALTLTARKLGILSKASNEMRADGLGFDAQLTNALVRATSFHLDYAFLRGTGAGQPLGILNDPALVTASKQGGQVANTITYVNCVDMLARLHPSCFSNSVWVASNRKIVVLPVSSILPVRKLSPGITKTEKCRRIASSMREVGIVKPLVVYPQANGGTLYVLRPRPQKPPTLDLPTLSR